MQWCFSDFEVVVDLVFFANMYIRTRTHSCLGPRIRIALHCMAALYIRIVSARLLFSTSLEVAYTKLFLQSVSFGAPVNAMRGFSESNPLGIHRMRSGIRYTRD